MAGLEPAMRESKSRALTAWLHPYGKEQGRSRCFGPAACSGVGEGTRTLDTRNHNPMLYQLNYAHHMKLERLGMVRLEGLEPPTHCLEGSCSIHLSYRRISCAPKLGPPREPSRRAAWGKEEQGHELNGHCSCAGAGDGNRTHATSLEGWDSTIELHPHRPTRSKSSALI